MRATTLYRIAAVLLLLFAAGHTYGFLSLRAPTEEGRAVFASMNSVFFTMQTHAYSYGRFYRGFGLYITVSQLFAAMFAWWLGGLAQRHPGEVQFITWIFVAVQVVGGVLSYLYFGPPPVVFSAVLVMVLAAAALRARSAVA